MIEACSFSLRPKLIELKVQRTMVIAFDIKSFQWSLKIWAKQVWSEKKNFTKRNYEIQQSLVVRSMKTFSRWGLQMIPCVSLAETSVLVNMKERVKEMRVFGCRLNFWHNVTSNISNKGKRVRCRKQNNNKKTIISSLRPKYMNFCFVVARCENGIFIQTTKLLFAMGLGRISFREREKSDFVREK